MLASILYSSLAIPYIYGFEPDIQHWHRVINYLMECAFLVDLVLSLFLLGYVDSRTYDIVLDRRKIRRRYLRSWFASDLLGSIPVDVIDALTDDSISQVGGGARVRAGAGRRRRHWPFARALRCRTGSTSLPSGRLSHGSTLQGASGFSFLRVLRVFKLFRLFRLFNLRGLEDMQSSWALTPSVLRLAKLMGSFLMVVHLVACGFWAMVNSGYFLYGSTELAETYSLSYKKYIHAVHWTVIVLSGSEQQAEAVEEKAYAAAMLFVGIGIFASVIGSASSVLTNLDSFAETRKQQLEKIKHYMAYRKVHKVVQLKIHKYYQYLFLSGQAEQHRELFNQVGSYC
jgi:hypothetical protein